MNLYSYKVIIFDLGGVLVELKGVDRMMELTHYRYSLSELWERWLTSPSIRAYESGKITTVEFGKRIVEEFEMDILPPLYLQEFSGWVAGKYAGTNELLAKIKQNVKIASLSNINELHWNRVKNMDFIHLFDYNFPSHITGRLKPDIETFLQTTNEIGIRPEEALFFDDNRLNVEGAKKAGINAVEVHGINEAKSYLNKIGLL